MRGPMPVPDYQTMMLPVLSLAADGNVHSSAEAIEHIAVLHHVSSEERAALLPSGRTPVLNNRTHWALTHLRHARLIESAGLGRFRITDRGREVLKEAPQRID